MGADLKVKTRSDTKDSFQYADGVPSRQPTTRQDIPKRRIFQYLVLLSAAAILSTIIPSPWSLSSSGNLSNVPLNTKSATADPADEWKDDTWPIRQPTPWDISTDFPYPRVLEYDVEEGTWLRLDVHPKTGDIVFDMVGDLYCISAEDAYHSGGAAVSRARPVLLGVPHDADPHFSPEGDRLVFRSDAELGVDNIWVMPWVGCEKADLRPAVLAGDGALKKALISKDVDEELLARGVKETMQRKELRLIREGRHEAQRVTNETYRTMTDARFHPSGSKVIATKWYTTSRTLGAGEGWEYPVPPLVSQEKRIIERGRGARLVGRSLPPGWTVEDYGEQQIGPEQFIWSANDTLIFSKNVVEESMFDYNHDMHKGIYAIFSRNTTTNRTETLVDAFPGGASRPEISRDGRTLAFVRRVRDYEALVLKDLQTGTIHHVWHGLTYDLSNIAAPMGTYPSFAFTPTDSAVIIWSSGQIYSVPLTTNHLGEKIASGSPSPIKFRAHIEKRLAETLPHEESVDLVGVETADTQRVRAFKDLRVDATGKKVVFQAAGATVVQVVGEDKITEVPVLYDDGVTPYYSPSFVPGTKHTLVLHARWSDQNFTAFEVADLDDGTAYEVGGLPFGRYLSPVIGHQGKIAFIKTAGDLLTGDIVATAGEGLYLGDVELPPSTKKATIKNLQFIPSDISTGDRISLQFINKDTQLLVQQSSRAFVIDLAGSRDIAGKPPHHTLAQGKMSTEIAIAPTSRSSAGAMLDKLSGKATSGYVADNVAFVDFHHLYLVSGTNLADGEEVWSKPANATKGLARLSLDGAHDITWSQDGKKIFWFLGPYLHSLEISKLDRCASQIKKDTETFGIACIKNLLEYQEIVVEHSTDIARLKRDSALSVQGAASQANSDVFVIFNATLITMETGDPEKDIIHGGVLVTRGGVIESAGSFADVTVPTGATALDAQGGFIVPGFIDVHAHWNGFSAPYPAKSWEMETFLAYGVTTLHNPSADTVDAYAERSRVERGQFIGPRIFQTGTVIYGASEPGLHQDIADMDEARSALVRLKAEGGPISTSYKNYNIPSRASRQRLLTVAKNLSMLCFPEGGMNYDWDLTYIIDGMTTIEHAIPIPTLYDDVLTLYASSGTGATPTHIVNYGGVMGEQYIWANEDLPNDPKLRRFTSHAILEGLTESTARPNTSYALFNTSTSVAKMVKQGLKAHIGAHGEPPLGVNYHAEMFFTQTGGLSNYEVLQAASASAAQTLGLFPSLGSLSPGKLADYLVYPPGVDLLEGSIKNSRDLQYVVRGGRVWEASTMEEVWPLKTKRQVMPPINAE